MMQKTTVYLPPDLKAALTREAERRQVSEATLIRSALEEALRSRIIPPRPALFVGSEPVAERADELLAGFGE